LRIHLRSTRHSLVLGAVALVLLAGCSSSGDDGSVAAPPSSSAAEAAPETEPPGEPLDSFCELVSADEVDAITGLTLAAQTNPDAVDGLPYALCQWVQEATNISAASVDARPLRGDGPATPEAWWSVNLQPLEDAVREVRPLPELGEHAYLAIDDGDVSVLWFPGPTTYAEARVRANAWDDAQRPTDAELEEMALELSDLVTERLQPHLPLPATEGG
jgi:hypothetical protein